MRHCSVQVRGLLTREELDRYNGLIKVGSYLEDQSQYDLAYIVQKEIDLLILPGIERLKDKGRARDRATAEYLESMKDHDDDGVTLFAEDALQFKKLIYEMRFDEVSARYAEFGSFYIGNLLTTETFEEMLKL